MTITVTQEQLNAMIQAGAEATLKKMQSGNASLPATTSAVASAAFTNFGPYGIMYLLTAAAATAFYTSRKPAQGETQAQCAAKDLSEMLSKKGPLLGAGVACGALSWPIISFIAPRLNGSWLKAASRLIASSSWQGTAAKMATALVTGMAGAFLARSAAQSLQGPSKTQKANEALKSKFEAAQLAMTQWESTQYTLIPSRAEGEADRAKQQERTEALNYFASQPLDSRMARAFNAYKATLKEKNTLIENLQAQLTEIVQSQSQQPPALPDSRNTGAGGRAPRGRSSRPMTEEQIRGFFHYTQPMSPDDRARIYNSLPDLHRQQIDNAYRENKDRENKDNDND